MASQTLQGCRILIVEDEFLLADDLAHVLDDAGATVLGPVPSVRDALELIAGEKAIDFAVLDVNLHGDMVFRSRMRWSHAACPSSSPPAMTNGRSPNVSSRCRGWKSRSGRSGYRASSNRSSHAARNNTIKSPGKIRTAAIVR